MAVARAGGPIWIAALMVRRRDWLTFSHLEPFAFLQAAVHDDGERLMAWRWREAGTQAAAEVPARAGRPEREQEAPL